jgi:hypothetical protein
MGRRMRRVSGAMATGCRRVLRARSGGSSKAESPMWLERGAWALEPNPTSFRFLPCVGGRKHAFG